MTKSVISLREADRFLAYGVDMIFLGEMCRQGLKGIRRAMR